jgi:hypothetical protein
MIDFFKKQRASSILGLTLDGNRLEAVVLRRANGSLQVRQMVVASLALSPLTGDPELVGREIRNHLDQAGIHERRCVVCLPLGMVLMLQTKLPDLPEADIESFLQIEAERGFHSGYENLFIATSRASATSGEKYAALMAIPRNQLAILEKVLKAAQLKPVAFSVGIAALESAAISTPGVLALAIGTNNIDLQATSGGGIVALRSLDGTIEADGAQKQIDADRVSREIRITLGQLPAPLGETVKKMKVFGRGEMARQFVKEISPRVESMGLKLELMERASDAQFDKAPAPEIVLSPALALAASYLQGATTWPEFLPPKVHPWKMVLATKFSSKKLGWAGAAAGGLVLCVVSAFLFQQWQFSHWQSKWKAMEPKVARLQTDQQLIRKFRPWFDDSVRGLRILRKVTEAFPEDGKVTAKSLEIRDLSMVTVSGIARDNQAYLKLLDQLATAREITSLGTDSTRGQAPAIQFTFNFQWEGGNSGN